MIHPMMQVASSVLSAVTEFGRSKIGGEGGCGLRDEIEGVYVCRTSR